ncbi:hypothetical protein [Paenibacillus sp. FSL H8-0034]|uniref:hypothetical protein n=1 Tax=Paenibacillus sp. FSL H8-0034 TaxID=2954671 RepID=UPI0030F70E9F
MENIISESNEYEYNNYNENSFKEEYSKLLITEMEEISLGNNSNKMNEKYFGST